MRAMKDSGIEWIGEIPKNWKTCRLKDYAHICNGRDYSEVLDDNGNYPVIGSGGQFAKACEPLYQKKSVLLGRKGTIDKPLFVDYPFWTVDTMYYTEIKENVSAKYFYYLCTQIEFDFYQYGSAVPSMTQRDLYNVNFPYPTLDEQRRIADYLDRKCSQIDAIIARQQEVIEKLKAYKLSVITEAVTSTDSQMCRFRNCITTIEQGWSPATAEIVGEDGWFVLSLSAVKNGKFIKLSKKPIDANENIPTQLSIKVGDLLMTRSNTRELVGDVCLVDSDCPKTIFSDLIYRISLNDTLLPCYAIFLLQSAFIRQQIQESARGSSGTMPKISHKSIKNLNIYLPSTPEQREISGFLRNKCNYIDTCIQGKERLIKKLTAYKKTLIYEVVTGKKEV